MGNCGVENLRHQSNNPSGLVQGIGAASTHGNIFRMPAKRPPRFSRRRRSSVAEGGKSSWRTLQSGRRSCAFCLWPASLGFRSTSCCMTGSRRGRPMGCGIEPQARSQTRAPQVTPAGRTGDKGWQPRTGPGTREDRRTRTQDRTTGARYRFFSQSLARLGRGGSARLNRTRLTEVIEAMTEFDAGKVDVQHLCKLAGVSRAHYGASALMPATLGRSGCIVTVIQGPS